MARTETVALSLIIQFSFALRRGQGRARIGAADTHDPYTARRALAQSLMSQCPEAFSSEYDLMTLMQHYPCRL